MSINTSAKNAIFYSIGEIVPRLIGFILLPLYTRYLTPADFGIISYTNTFVLFLFTIGTLSLNSYAIRYYFLKEGEQQKDMLGTIAISIVLFNLLILALCYLILPTAIDYYGIQVPWKPYFQLALLTNFFDSFSIIPFVIYRVRGAAEKFVALGVSKTICVVILTVYTVVLKGYGLEGYYWSQFCVYLPFTFIYLYILRQYANFRFKMPVLREGLVFSLPLVPGAICYFLLNASDRIILERNVDISELGIYNMAITLSFALNVIVQGGYRAFEPALFSHYGKAGYEETVRKVKMIFFLIVFVGGVFISLMSKEIFVMMTESQYHRGYIYVPLLVSVVCMQSLNSLYGVVLAGDKRTGVMATSTIVGGITSVCLNLLLIPLFGVFVAAVTQVVAMFVMAFLKWKVIKINGLGMLQELILIGSMVAMSYLVFHIFPEVGIVSIAAKVFIGTIISFGLMRLYGIKVAEVKTLLGLKK